MAAATGFDAFVEGLDYPMFVVTATSTSATPAGCLVGFATQCSIDPPRLLVCLSTSNHTYAVARDATHLAVHALARHQRDLARLFGEQTGDEIDKFARCSWYAGPHGAPLIADCPRWLVGRVLQQVPLGDHVGFLLEPTDVSPPRSLDALTFLQIRDLDAGHPA